MNKSKRNKKGTVYFNMQVRGICDCGHPQGFCKHTIEDEYKDTCPETPMKKEQIWQFTRDLARYKFFERNILHYLRRDVDEMNNKQEKSRQEIKILNDKYKEILEVLK